MSKLPPFLIALSFSFLVVIGVMGYLVPRDNAFWLLVAFTISFGLFWILFRLATSGSYPLSYFFGLAVMARLVLLVAWPSLSDDFARFLWDGFLVLKGVSPYKYTPSEVMAHGTLGAEKFLVELFPYLNSPNYFSVYPPLNQVIFSLAVFTGTYDLFYSLVSLRVLLLIAEMATLLIIWKLLLVNGLPSVNSLLYALNPLVIIEVSGNLHFEGMMLLCILCVFAFVNRNATLGGVWFAAAVSVKLIPLILLPYLMVRNYYRHAQVFGFTVAFVVFLLVCNLAVFPYLENFLASVQLYYGKFEFNASVYYVVRNVSMIWVDFNPIQYIAPFLSMIAAVGILFFSFRFHNQLDIFDLSVVIYLVYLTFQAVVHPWYILVPLGLSVFTKIRTMQVWSFLISLSYLNYRSIPVSESSWILILQYLIVFIFLVRDWQNLNRPQTIQ
jgi:alpha-1,6-mannosyltransferase